MPPSRNRYEKMAILLLACGEELASALLKELKDQPEFKKISQAMATLQRVGQEEVDGILLEFSQTLEKAPVLEGGADFTEKLLDKVLHQSSELRRQFSFKSSASRILESVPAVTLAAFIRGERVQTIALILAQLDSKKAADTLGFLTLETQSEVLTRMASLNPIEPGLLDYVNEFLMDHAQQLSQRPKKGLGGAAAVSKMLLTLDKEKSNQLLDAIGQRDPQLLQDVEVNMFGFEDLKKLSDADIQKILPRLKADSLRKALKQASPELKACLFKNMSKRAAKILEDEIANSPKLPLSEVQTCQREIVHLVLQMQEDGTLEV